MPFEKRWSLTFGRWVAVLLEGLLAPGRQLLEKLRHGARTPNAVEVRVGSEPDGARDCC